MPSVRDDLEFIKKEGGKFVDFSRDFLVEQTDNLKNKTVVNAIEFGLFQWLKLLLIGIAIFLFFLTFSWIKSFGTFLVILGIAGFVYKFVFGSDLGKGFGILSSVFSFFFDIISALFNVVIDIVTGIFEIMKEIIIDLVMTVWEFAMDIFNDVFSIVKELIFDITKSIWELASDIVSEITTSLFEIAKDLVTAIKDVVVDIFSFSKSG